MAQQPALQRLSTHNNWRLCYNQQLIPSNDEEGQQDQWEADFVPQPWQNDVISDELPALDLFVPLLADRGLTADEIQEIIDHA